jgi:hypothetical protein
MYLLCFYLLLVIIFSAEKTKIISNNNITTITIKMPPKKKMEEKRRATAGSAFVRLNQHQQQPSTPTEASSALQTHSERLEKYRELSMREIRSPQQQQKQLHQQQRPPHIFPDLSHIPAYSATTKAPEAFPYKSTGNLPPPAPGTAAHYIEEKKRYNSLKKIGIPIPRPSLPPVLGGRDPTKRVLPQRWPGKKYKEPSEDEEEEEEPLEDEEEVMEVLEEGMVPGMFTF